MSARVVRSEAAVVVLTCGSARTTLACLASVAAGRYSPLQLLVVCNGGDPALAAALRGFADRVTGPDREVHLIFNEKNIGACAGRNQALARIDAEFVAFLDNDVFCDDPWWLDRAVALLRSEASAGLVGPRIVHLARPLCLECAGYAIDPRGQVDALGAGRSPRDPRWRQVRIVQAVGNFVARTRTMRQVGGFDPAFDPFGFENIDCCYRAKAAGYTVLCDGHSDLYHVGHVTTGSFEEGGRRILFEKSLLLRRRWQAVFVRERALFESLMAGESPVAPVEAAP